jgi:hypothetical protein
LRKNIEIGQRKHSASVSEVGIASKNSDITAENDTADVFEVERPSSPAAVGLSEVMGEGEEEYHELDGICISRIGLRVLAKQHPIDQMDA